MGRVLNAIQDLGELDNTLVIYIQGDNGASAEGGQQGLLNELAFFNAVPEDFKQVMARMDDLGGPSRSTIIRLVGRTAWTRRFSGRSRSLRTSAAHATEWPSLGRRGSRTMVASVHNSITLSISRLPSLKPSACALPRSSMACRKNQWKA
jgi:arylsulfatase A-like enzyme